MDSKQYTLNTFDWKKILIGSGIAATGAVLTYGTSLVANTNFGEWTPVVVAAWSIVANIVRKWLAGASVVKVEEPVQSE